MAEPPRKRAKFSLNAGQKLLASKGRLPDLKELSPIAKESPAPSSVREKFCGPGRFIGIDVETHALDARTRSRDWQGGGLHSGGVDYDRSQLSNSSSSAPGKQLRKGQRKCGSLSLENGA